jgi:hypothetical protein
VTSPATARMARNIQLTRTAQLAGEAFAFTDHAAVAPSARRPLLGGLGWVFIAAAAAAAIYLGL